MRDQLMAIIGMGKPLEGLRDIRARLARCAGPDGIEILNALFERLESVENGVDAERFRIELKARRDEIDKLGQRFIKDEYTPKRTYRPTVIALPLINDDRAEKQLALVDQVLRYISSIYEEAPGRQITLGEICNSQNASQERVAEALVYVNDSPASCSHRSGFPAESAWYVVPGEQSLDYPDLDAVLKQMTTWAEQEAATRRRGYSGIPVLEHAQPEQKSWIARNKVLTVIGACVTFLASIATVIAFVMDVFDRE